jgi:hypothetical protein
VLWHDAHVFAARDPMAFHSLLSAWLRDLPPHVLLMLVAPVPLVPATRPAAPPRPPIEPDVATRVRAVARVVEAAARRARLTARPFTAGRGSARRRCC